jgi:hypothetical protein
VLASALDQMQFGDYEGVERTLKPIAENGALALTSNDDRLEALRAYGIACAVQKHRVAAIGAFLLLLEERPALRLDTRLVPAEAVALFEEVRERYPPARPLRLGQPLSPEMRAGVGLIISGGAVGVVGVVVGLTFLGGAYLNPSTAAIIAPPVSLIGVSFVATGIGVGLLVRGNRKQKAE